MSSVLLAKNHVLITDQAHRESKQLFEETKDLNRIRFLSELDNGEQLALSESISELLKVVLNLAASGGKVTFTTIPSEMTTAAAASWLGISRPTLMKHVREGLIPAKKTGSHTRIKTEDLEKFNDQRNKKQKKTFSELRSLSGVMD